MSATHSLDPTSFANSMETAESSIRVSLSPAEPHPHTSSMSLSLVAAMVLVAALLTAAPVRAADEGNPFPVDVWEPPFNQQRQHVRREYVPLTHASKMWKLCAAIPHLKDDYWLAVNSALIQESRRLGVRLNVFEEI